MTAAVRALRGATTVDADTPEQIHERVGALVNEMLDRNAVDKDALISVILKLSREGRRSLNLRRLDLEQLLRASVDGVRGATPKVRAEHDTLAVPPRTVFPSLLAPRS